MCRQKKIDKTKSAGDVPLLLADHLREVEKEERNNGDDGTSVLTVFYESSCAVGATLPVVHLCAASTYASVYQAGNFLRVLNKIFLI